MAKAASSTVLPGSYIGKDLDIKQSIVNQHQILRGTLPKPRHRIIRGAV